jgi:hypothetical protein
MDKQSEQNIITIIDKHTYAYKIVFLAHIQKKCFKYFEI